MPNHVANRLIVNAPLGDVRSHCRSGEQAVSFAKLLPPPINIWMGDVGPEHKRAFLDNALDWRRRNWGTKWDAYGGPTLEDDPSGAVLKFETAWAPPRGWVVALFNSLECRIDHYWLDEGSETAFHDKYSIDPKWGNRWSSEPCDPKMQIEMEIQQWGRPRAEIDAEIEEA